MKDFSRPSSFTGDPAQGANQNIWTSNQSSSHQKRPSSLDNIWSSNPPNIWSSNTKSNTLPISSPPDFLSHNQHQVQTFSTRNSFSGNQSSSFSPKGSPHILDMNPFESSSLNQYEFNLRRHSYGDVYNHSVNTTQFLNPPPASSHQLQPHQQHQQPYPSFLNNQDDLNSTLELVNEYFEQDPHERVKVTVKLLNERFFDEEKYLSDAYQLPKFPVENSLRNYQLALVGFKAGRIDVFYLPQKSSTGADLTNLKVGDLVIVEADRGRDLGKIFKMNISIDEARLMKLLQFQEQQAALSENDNADLSVKNLSEHSVAATSSNPPTLHFPKSILSLAQPNEIIQILNKKQDEEKACRLCLAKIANSTGLLNTTGGVNLNQSDLMQMKLIDAEYQFDRKKLIFYYSTTKRIDFRDLVRELFRIYKTRIWMCAVIGLPYIPNQNCQQPQQNFQQQTSKFITSPIMTSPNLIGGSSFIPQQQPTQQIPAPSQQPAPPLFQYQASNQMPSQIPSNYQQSVDSIPRLSDPFKQTIISPNYSQQSSVPYNLAIDRRLSYQSSSFNSESTQIPRNFPETNGSEGKKDDNSGNGESLVLKSLVDSINH